MLALRSLHVREDMRAVARAVSGIILRQKNVGELVARLVKRLAQLRNTVVRQAVYLSFMSTHIRAERALRAANRRLPYSVLVLVLTQKTSPIPHSILVVGLTQKCLLVLEREMPLALTGGILHPLSTPSRTPRFSLKSTTRVFIPSSGMEME
jgi:hypothetical protein